MSRKRDSLVEARRDRENAQRILRAVSCALKMLPNGDLRNSLLNIVRTYIMNNNCSIVVHPESPILAEDKLLIRDDCNGNISGNLLEYMSPEYIEALKTEGGKNKKLYGVSEYSRALEESIYGREMKGYNSYASIEYPLLINLVNQRIKPDIIRKMKKTDFRDFVKKFCYEEFMVYHEKKGFIKIFINENETDFYNLLCDNGTNPFFVEQLIKNMRTEGCADSFVFEYKGHEITGPGFDTDHKNPVYNPHDVASYAVVNTPPFLAVVEKDTHRLKHQLERRVELGDGVIVYEKLMWPKYSAAVLDFEHYLVHDFDNPNRKVISSPPHGNNLVFLNKIDTYMQATGIYELLNRTQIVDRKRHGGRG